MKDIMLWKLIKSERGIKNTRYCTICITYIFCVVSISATSIGHGIMQNVTKKLIKIMLDLKSVRIWGMTITLYTQCLSDLESGFKSFKCVLCNP